VKVICASNLIFYVQKGKGNHMCGMKEVHLTNASIPGVRCLREMKASTNKIRRDIIYTSKKIVKPEIMECLLKIYPR